MKCLPHKRITTIHAYINVIICWVWFVGKSCSVRCMCVCVCVCQTETIIGFVRKTAFQHTFQQATRQRENKRKTRAKKAHTFTTPLSSSHWRNSICVWPRPKGYALPGWRQTHPQLNGGAASRTTGGVVRLDWKGAKHWPACRVGENPQHFSNVRWIKNKSTKMMFLHKATGKFHIFSYRWKNVEFIKNENL